MTEFACDTAAFSDLRLTEALGTIARLGFRYADLKINPHLNLVKIAADPRRIADDLIADLRVYNLKLANVSLTLPDALLSDNDDERQMVLDQFAAMLPLFQALELPGITLSLLEDEETARKPVVDDEEASADAAQQRHVRRAEALRRIQALAAPIALRIAASDMHFFDSLNDIEPLLQAVPNLMLSLDAGTLADDQNIERRPELLQRTAHLTLESTLDGFSRDEAVALMQTLHEAGYAGVLSVTVSRVEDTPASVKAPKPTTAPPITPVRRLLTLRDNLRTARDQVMGRPLLSAR